MCITPIELDEKTSQQLEEDNAISKAMDKRKQDLEFEIKMIIHQFNRLTTRYIEIESELKEYEEEY